jgi:hypothetical protein
MECESVYEDFEGFFPPEIIHAEDVGTDQLSEIMATDLI